MDRMFMLFNRRQLKRRFGLYRVRTKTSATVAMGVFIGLVVVSLFTAFLFAWYAKDLPRPDRVSRTEGLSTVILDRNGETLYDIYENQNRLPVKFEDVPEYLKQATLAIEDKDFYKHQGLSTIGIVRGLTACVLLRRCQGGSTLTQQLVKNVLLTNERSIPRKIKEAILAIQIERKYTKDEILHMYLNEAPYGGTAVGVEAASQYYFAKPVHDLTLIESAVIAGLPQSPSQYSPFTGEPKAYVWRTQQVLRRMREDGYITSAQETEANKQLDSITFAVESEALRAPHFIAYVKDQLVEKFGSQRVEGGGLKVTTTLDWKIQDKAQTIVKEEVTKAKSLKVSNGSAVVLDPKTGEILAMVGSKDYSATDVSGLKFNVAVQGLRQPGSAIKPITYAAAFKKGYTPSTLLVDVDTKYPSGDASKPDYNPKNYDGKYRGPTQLRYALGNSINTIAVKVSALVGIKDILRLGYDMGIASFEPTDDLMKRVGLSLTLGGGEVTLLDLTSAYGVFATGGYRSDPVAILKVEDPKGKVLFEHKAVAARQVLAPDIAFLVSDILSDNDARKEIFGTRSYLVISGHTVAAKTGTTDDKRDNWTIGYTPSVVVGTWVGNNDNSPMHSSLASGVTGAAPIWNRIMSEYLKAKKDEPFVRPDSIVETEIDGYGGGLPVDGQPRRMERFIRGTEPTGPSSIYQNLKISRKDSGKLANPVEISKGEYDVKQYIVFTERDPVSTDGSNRWQEGIQAWVATLGDSKYHPPTEVYQGSDSSIVVSIKDPADQAQVSETVTIRIEAATSDGSIAKIELYVDGEKKKEYTDKTINDSISLGSSRPYCVISAKATDTNGRTADTVIHVGVGQPYASPTPSPAPTPTP
jgi:1A family penicillin-binding protein